MSIPIDTGPLYAFFDRNDYWNHWAGQKFAELIPPFLTCEAVITETLFLLQNSNIDTINLFELINRSLLHIQPVVNTPDGQNRIQALMTKYDDLPASFADVCLVWMAETTGEPRIFTIDSDFTIYRTSKGEPISLISPF